MVVVAVDDGGVGCMWVCGYVGMCGWVWVYVGVDEVGVYAAVGIGWKGGKEQGSAGGIHQILRGWAGGIHQILHLPIRVVDVIWADCAPLPPEVTQHALWHVAHGTWHMARGT